MAVSQPRAPWATYEQSIGLQHERVFDALVDLVWEKGSFKTPLTFVKKRPRCIDDRRHIARSRAEWWCLVRQSATSVTPFGGISFGKAKCCLSDRINDIGKA